MYSLLVYSNHLLLARQKHLAHFFPYFIGLGQGTRLKEILVLQAGMRRYDDIKWRDYFPSNQSFVISSNVCYSLICLIK